MQKTRKLGPHSLTRFYKRQGEVKERYYVPPHPNQRFREGDTIRFKDSLSSAYYGLVGLTAKVLARYFTQNYGFRNYGMCIQIIKGNIRHPEGKVMHLPMNVQAAKEKN